MANVQTHDVLHRRDRRRPVSTGKCVSLQERDLLWLKKIHEHGPLSTSFLHAFSRHMCRSEKRAKDRLTDLFNEDRTPHGGAYLSRPWQQFETFDSRYQQLVHDMAPAGENALEQMGAWHELAGGASGPWKHRYMVAAITASVELATLDREDLAYIPQHVILERANATLRYPVRIENPTTRQQELRDLIPDALFGLEYRTSAGPRYRFFIVEADRGTEPTQSSCMSRKSHRRNFLQYREYVGRGLYKQHLGLTAALMVLNVVAHPATMRSMMAQLQEISPGGNSYQLFRQMDGMGRAFRPVGPPANSILRDWNSVGDTMRDIDGL